MSAWMSEPMGSHFPPGALVRARGREWIVLPGSSPDRLRLRPLSGSEADVAGYDAFWSYVPWGK